MNNLGYILTSGVFGVAGQLILKRGIAGMGPLSLRPDALPGVALSLILNPLVLLGLAVYACGTFLWLIALSRVDLSYAYPFASLNYVLVLLASWLVLGEQPSIPRVIGVVVICCGVFAISRTPSKTRLPSRRPAGLAMQTTSGGSKQ
jgi:drug/metabolite transporter (DMT)-like permease